MFIVYRAWVLWEMSVIMTAESTAPPLGMNDYQSQRAPVGHYVGVCMWELLIGA